MKVIIIGIGDIGRKLAEELSSREGFELVLIDNDEEKCEALSQEIDALVLHGDGTEPEVLNEAGAKEADALIATTESDALNMVIAILAKRFSISKAIVKLNKTGLKNACQEIGIDHVILPKVSAAMEIVSILHGYDMLDLSLLVQGGVRLTEISPGKMADKKIEDINLPEGTSIIAILQEDVATIAKEDTKLSEDDRLLILAENDEKLEEVEDIFGELK